MEEDAFWILQCDGDLSKTDGSGFDQHNKEVWESRDVLCGGTDSYTHLGGPP